MIDAYGFKRSATVVGDLYSSSRYPYLFLLNKENSGKAESLNQALRYFDCDIMMTVDADTLLEADAIYETHKAFVKESNLVAACGILQPVTRSGLGARIFVIFLYFGSMHLWSSYMLYTLVAPH